MSEVATNSVASCAGSTGATGTFDSRNEDGHPYAKGAKVSRRTQKIHGNFSDSPFAPFA